MFSLGNNRTYDDFKKQVSLEILPLFDLLRDFCFSLGNDVIEDVRMHRIVFCKSFNFRWFADLEPKNDCILIKIQSDRKLPQKNFRIMPGKNLDELRTNLRVAHNKIH